MTGVCTVPTCEATDDVHPYIVGLRCPKHTPAAEGDPPRPEPATMVDPALVYWSTSSPSRSASAVLEERHRAKGQTASPALRAIVRESS